MTDILLAKNKSYKPIISSLILVGFFALLHLTIANRAGLTVDGAHYALYGQHLAFSYYDHPPLVGWLQALVLPFGHSNLIMRIWPMVITILWLLALYKLTQLLFPTQSQWLGFVTIAIAQSAVLLNMLALAMIPQVPFILFALLSVLSLYTAVESEKCHHWLLFGLFLGLAGLAEYTAVCLAVTAVLYVITTKPKLLFKPAPWLAIIIAALCITPILYWNFQHDWLSIRYQLHHGTHGGHWELSRFFVSQLIQFGAYSPIIYLLGLWVLIKNIALIYKKPVRLLLFTALPVLILFGYAGGYERTLPHWPALGWIALMPLMANWLIKTWPAIKTKLCIWLGGLYSLTLLLLIHVQILHPFLPFNHYQNPLVDLYGWQKAATIAKQELATLQSQSNQKLHLFVPNWTLASRLAWYTQLPVQVANDRIGPDQFSLWFGKPKTGASGLLIVPHGWGNPPHTGKQAGEFKSCQLVTQLPVKQSRVLVTTFYFYHCQHFEAPK